MPQRLGILSTHPIQYYSPWYRALALRPEIDLTVFYAHQQTAEGQAAAGFGVAFEWDVPLLEGYPYEFLHNRARRPNVFEFWGCDTPEIASRIASGSFDAFLVHGWYNRSFWQAMRACWRAKTPLLIRGDSQLRTPRNLLKRWAKQVTHRWFVPRFDAYLVVGQRAREYYLAYGARPERLFFCPHFVDNDWFSRTANEQKPRRGELRNEFGLDGSACVFLFAGKFIPKKRPLDFVRAIALAHRQHAGLMGAMVGDGPLRGDVEAAIARERAPVRLLGFLNQSRMCAAYAMADCLVLPSDGGETWGLVVNEAMASGLCAIVSDQVGCAPDLVTQGETGSVYPCADVASLADRFVAGARDPAALKQMGSAACQRIEKYSIETAVDGACRALGWLCRAEPRHAIPFRGNGTYDH